MWERRRVRNRGGITETWGARKMYGVIGVDGKDCAFAWKAVRTNNLMSDIGITLSAREKSIQGSYFGVELAKSLNQITL